MKKFLLAILSSVLLVPQAFALPALQLYSPSATYDFGSDTWIVGSGDFELWLIAAKTDVKPLYNIRIVGALDPENIPLDGALTIGGTTFSASDYHFGIPPLAPDSGSMPPHGIYPTNFVEFFVGDVLDAPEIVMDMQPGEDGTGMGKIFKYQVNSTYDYVHFDAYGYYDPYKFKFAPFSHDLEIIPEPATILLLGTGLIGGSLLRRRKRQ